MVGSILAGGASITDKPILLYGCKMWPVLVTNEKRSEDVESVCLLWNCEVVCAYLEYEGSFAEFVILRG